MRRNVIFFVATIFFCFSAVARGNQASSAAAFSQTGNQPSANLARDCSGDFDTRNEARQAADRDQHQSQAQSDPVGASEMADVALSAVNLERDLKFIEMRYSELA